MVNAITSWRTFASTSAMRATSIRARSRSLRAASLGTTPSSASVSVAASSTSSHFLNLFPSLQTRPISARVYRAINRCSSDYRNSWRKTPCSIIPETRLRESGGVAMGASVWLAFFDLALAKKLAPSVAALGHAGGRSWRSRGVGRPGRYFAGDDRVAELGEQDHGHGVFRRGPFYGFGKFGDGIAETFDDGFALIGDAFALQALGLGVGFRFFHQEQLFSFGAGYGGFAFARRGVYIVHPRLPFFVGHKIGDERFHDRVAEFAHRGIEIVFHVDGNLGLLVEGFIERHFGDVAEDHVVNERFDLLDGVGQLVKSVIHPIGHHFVLHGNWNLDEDVVFRLRFDFHVELLDLEADVGDDHIQIGRLEIQAGLRNA